MNHWHPKVLLHSVIGGSLSLIPLVLFLIINPGYELKPFTDLLLATCFGFYFQKRGVEKQPNLARIEFEPLRVPFLIFSMAAAYFGQMITVILTLPILLAIT